MNLKQIIKEYIEKNGFDGLLNQDEECGCLIDDLFPCTNNFNIEDCEPGYKHPGRSEEYDFLICPNKYDGEKNNA